MNSNSIYFPLFLSRCRIKETLRTLPVESVLSLSSRNLFNTEINFKWFLRRIWWPGRGGHPFYSAVTLSCSLKSLERPGMVPCSWQHRLCCPRIASAEGGFKLMQEGALVIPSSLMLRVLSHSGQTFLEYFFFFQGADLWNRGASLAEDQPHQQRP